VRWFAVAAAALMAAAFVAPATAGAKTPPTSTAHLQGTYQAAAVHGGLTPSVSTSAYGGGYFVYPGTFTGDVASASAVFTAPAISCASGTDLEWLLPGIWVYQAGVITQQVDVNLNCNSGVLYTQAIICLSTGSCDSTLTINAGDRVLLSFYEGANSMYGSVRDFTTGQVATVTAAAPATHDDTVLIGDAGPGQFGFATKVPTFSTLTFAKAEVNGYYISDQTSARYNLVSTHRVQISTGLLTDRGDRFVTRFVHN